MNALSELILNLLQIVVFVIILSSAFGVMLCPPGGTEGIKKVLTWEWNLVKTVLKWTLQQVLTVLRNACDAGLNRLR